VGDVSKAEKKEATAVEKPDLCFPIDCARKKVKNITTIRKLLEIRLSSSKVRNRRSRKRKGKRPRLRGSKGAGIRLPTVSLKVREPKGEQGKGGEKGQGVFVVSNKEP